MKALIIGHSGQDGKLLVEQLLARRYGLAGFSGRTFYSNCGFQPNSAPNVLNYNQMAWLVSSLKPDEIYYLAAYNFSSEDNLDEQSDARFTKNRQTHVDGLLNVLEAVRQHSPRSRLFYAGSSLVFGDWAGTKQDEDTRFDPEGFYGITKAIGTVLCREYRLKYDLFCVAGILYNHESIYRSKNYLSSKLIRQAIQIKQGAISHITVGNPEASVDWGYAPDYVDAFTRTLKLDEPENFVIATGQLHTVQDFIDAVFDCLGIDPQDKINVDEQIMARKHKTRVGDASKLRRLTGWSPSLDFRGMIARLVEQRLQNPG